MTRCHTRNSRGLGPVQAARYGAAEESLLCMMRGVKARVRLRERRETPRRTRLRAREPSLELARSSDESVDAGVGNDGDGEPKANHTPGIGATAAAAEAQEAHRMRDACKGLRVPPHTYAHTHGRVSGGLGLPARVEARFFRIRSSLRRILLTNAKLDA